MSLNRIGSKYINFILTEIINVQIHPYQTLAFNHFTRSQALYTTNMNMLTEWALTNLVAYGVPMLVLISYVGSLGIPFPITFVIISAGAFTRTGLLDWRLAVLACLVGSALADNSEYLLGRMAHKWLKKRFGGKPVWQKAQSTINRQGGWAILLTRFWLTPLAPAINVIAGSRYPYVRFLFFDLVGQLLWVLLYGGLGYLFAAELEAISQTVSWFSGLSVVLVLLANGAYFLVKRHKTSPASELVLEPSVLGTRPLLQEINIYAGLKRYDRKDAGWYGNKGRIERMKGWPMKTSILAVIPAYNESEHIAKVVEVARRSLPVLVVDDGSFDETARQAEAAGAEALRQVPNQGKGAALRAGIRRALDQGYEAVITLDGDGQHDAAEITKFLEAYNNQPADLIIGKRSFNKMPLTRRLANTGGRWLFTWAIGQPIPDNQSGYRLVSRRLMEALLASSESGFEFEVEMFATCLKRKYVLAWVPIRTIYCGETSHIHPFHHLVNFLRIIWSTRQRMRA
jgi:membrane protein DedA with SNARE-associated domain